ncbi:expressed unknown protein [Seminavis robusta]|uniref:Centromere protein S n=1 Tax=Seminavis robusta TaxID=568900 RepID=A0A9N8HPD5_9STRA|nr:expressed unknown protein [Seminavis robusta]|eukprot:Sro1060_g236610.1 n/a (256) ;mRNA; f:1050-1817
MNTSTSNDNQDVRKALQHAVQTICAKVEEEEDEQAEEDDSHKMGAMTPSAILALTELTYQFATTALANDLSAFSSHANRKTVTVEDVLLVVRKNPSIQQKLQQFCDIQKKQPQRKKKQARPKKDVEVDSSSSDNESDKEDFSENMLVNTDTEKSPPAKAIGNVKKRARPIAKKPLAIRDDDDSSSASSSGNGSTPKTKKSNYFQTKKQQTAIDIEDSSTEEEEEEESPEKKSEICALLETTITMASPDDDDDDSY